jgi:hypothetical protein
VTDHLTGERSDRGFLHMPALNDSYGANAVRVFESSSAIGPHLWLRVRDGGDTPVAHLTAEQAWQLKEQIEYLLEHHYQGDARPKDQTGTPDTRP